MYQTRGGVKTFLSHLSQQGTFASCFPDIHFNLSSSWTWLRRLISPLLSRKWNNYSSFFGRYSIICLYKHNSSHKEHGLLMNKCHRSELSALSALGGRGSTKISVNLWNKSCQRCTTCTATTDNASEAECVNSVQCWCWIEGLENGVKGVVRTTASTRKL